MPCLLQADHKVEREAAHIYYGENTFEVSEPQDLDSWVKLVHKRHYNRIRKVLLKIPRLVPRNSAADNEASLLKLGTMRGLESLIVELDEQEAIKAMLERSRPGVQWHSSLGYGPQVQLHVMYLDGMHVLRAMRGLKHVEFMSPKGQTNAVTGGILPLIGREMMQPLELETSEPQGHFPFLSLPPELRSVIYEMLLVNPGVTYPRKGYPTSVSSTMKWTGLAKRARISVPLSALELLCVNRQIHDEAFKVFYRNNDLVFSEPVQLQDFMMSISIERLEHLRSVTLFCRQYDPADGASVTDAVLCSLRCLRGLQKLHLLLPASEYQSRYWESLRSLPGVKMLFSFRRLLDIRYRDLYHEDVVEKGTAESKLLKKARQWVAAFRHLDHGLQLAQKDVVVSKLHTEKWEQEEDRPAL